MVQKNELNDKLDLILKNQKKILENEEKILKEEVKIEKLEDQELKKEDLNQETEEEALDELLKIEKEIIKNNNPIKNITRKDLFKGFVGAFAGLMGHFAFSKGFELGTSLTIYQATVLYIVAFFVINVMLYYTGFKKIQKKLILKFMPIRATILYTVSIFTILLVYLLFGKLHFPVHFWELYKVIGSSITLAVMGAGTADLIGGNGGH